MFRQFACFAAACSLLSVSSAQVAQFGGDGEQKTSTLFYFDQGAQKFLGGIELSYGTPEWKDDYSKNLKADKDMAFRLGKNGWSRLSNTVPLNMGGVDIPAGNWCLGLGKKEGKFVLMVLDSKTMGKKGVPPWATAQIRATINAPLTLGKSEEVADKLHMSLKGDKSVPGKSTFVLRWGPHILKAKVKAKLGVKYKKKSDFGGNDDDGGKKGTR